MRELSLHILDIVENSIAAEASEVEIVVIEDYHQDRLYLSVRDNGRGMDAELAAKVVDPFVTSRTTRKVGLGIPLLKAAAEACNGYLNLTSTPGTGTLIEVEFQNSHIDRMPMGDLNTTILQLVVGYPDIHFIYKSRSADKEFIFDDKDIKKELQGVSLCEPAVLEYLRGELSVDVLEIQLENVK